MTAALLPGPVPLPPAVLAIVERLEHAGFSTWCVGGTLRDWLLTPTRPLAYEVDLATAATPDQVRGLFPRTLAVGAKYGTIGVLDPQGVLHEVTTFRKDVTTDGRHAVVEYGVSIEEDLHRRDFTINAMAYHPLTHRWLDPEQGAEDLRAGVVRAVGDPAARFREDYLRILRMVRFAARFGFTIDPATFAAARAAADGLARLSAERVRDEWFKGLLSAKALGHFVGLWREAGAADPWLAELRSPPPALTEQPGAARDPVVLTTALAERPARVLRRLKASGAEIARADAMERGPAHPPGEQEVAVRRWLSRVGRAAEDLIGLTELAGGVPPAWVGVARQIQQRADPLSRDDLALKGDDLRAAGISPGPEMGKLLDRLLDAVLEQPECNTRESLLDLVATWR